MSKITKLKSFLQKTVPGIQVFDTPNWAGDPMKKIYDKDGITVLHCEYWDYIEIFGLTDRQFESLTIDGAGSCLKKFSAKEEE